jgi:DNA-binding beta-propeller fold protein YncE
MRFGRLQCLILAAALVGALGGATALAGPLAVVANFTDPGIGAGPPWPAGTVNVIDTATDKQVGAPLKVGANPMAVAITPDGKTAVVACAQSSELYFIDLSANPPAVLGKLSVGSGSGDTFYPAGLTISPDGQYVAVTSTVGSQTQKSTQIRNILLVGIKDRSLAQTLDLQADQAPLTAEAAAFTTAGSLLVVGPSAQPPAIFGLEYETGQIMPPDVDTDTQKNKLGGLQGATGFNVAIAPDGSLALVPLGRSADGKSGLAVLHLDATGKITDDSVTPIASGGDGPHSVAFSPDGKLVYVRNLLPPNNNIAVFSVGSGGSLTDTHQRLNAEGIPQTILDLDPSQYQPGALGFVGSQMIAVTPDGKKIYAANPLGGRPDPASLGLYGSGNLLVFDASKKDPIQRLEFGKNPIAVAIQKQ